MTLLAPLRSFGSNALRANDADNRYGMGLMSLGLIGVLGAIYAHRNWPGVTGLILWVPGVVLGLRYLVVRIRKNMRNPRLSVKSARENAAVSGR